ncbi:MAG TPA: maltose alpha-D-glucosyltransferase [Longimicrobiales bacterium]|nr:maltose alpha-D-glucosyltransferase [Longimicrobiales bacterium]
MSEPLTETLSDPLWYKDAVIYELHVRAFRDSNGDGMGDFRGLTEKLDYLEDLGVTALWILPYYPSPWRDDGYDIADYTSVHPAYGNVEDFQEFMNAAHARGLRVITELVINHTSDQHPWFQRARKALPGDPHRDFYVWNETSEKYRDARIIFKDFETSNWAWDSVAGEYYWHRFFSHQPDLNFENPAVHQALFDVLDFWMKMGVDGMRLDAIPYLYEEEGTNCENLPRTHEFLKLLRKHVDSNFANRMLLAEANQWPEETVPYFGNGDECHMAFHFPVMPRLFMAIRMEDRFPIIDILNQTPPIHETNQWAMFLRNHDELTLEMVTDEERDYMYRTYASDLRARINLGIRRRLAPLLGNDRRTIELMNCLLFSLPGTPVLYYGDEIGMGDNIYLGDRNGVRTPMQWSGDRNAGFSDANPQKLYLPAIIDPEYHFGTVNVEAQQGNPNSLLWWMKRIIALRKRYQAFGRGSIEFLMPENRKVLVFLRQYNEETILVVVNLSRLVQYVSLDLTRFSGSVPVELFGRTEFPQIGEDPFVLTLGGHSFYWFELTPARNDDVPVDEHGVRAPAVAATSIDDLKRNRAAERILQGYVTKQRWFRSKSRTVRNVNIVETIPVDSGVLAVVQVDYPDAEPEEYLLPLMVVSGEEAVLLQARPIAELTGAGVAKFLIDGSYSPDFGRALLRLANVAGDGLEPRLLGAEQSNTSIAYGDKLVLKLYRKLEAGEALDLEVGRFLTEQDFTHSPRVVGAIEHQRNGQRVTLGVIHEFTPNEGDAWAYTLDTLGRYYERAAARTDAVPPATLESSVHALLGSAPAELPAVAHELVGSYLEDARLLGVRTAELHNVLGGPSDSAAFTPEEFTIFYQRSLYQSMRNLTGRVFQGVSDPAVSSLEKDVLAHFRRLVDTRVRGVRIRLHGDYHLGQVLYTGKDFVITDFEGEPLHPLSERRLKRSPLRDVAGMLRSFHYAAYSPLIKGESGIVLRTEDVSMLEQWAQAWYRWVSASYLNGYFSAIKRELLPPSVEELATLLEAYLLEKAVYELGYEMNNRPEWVRIPLRGLADLLEKRA